MARRVATSDTRECTVRTATHRPAEFELINPHISHVSDMSRYPQGALMPTCGARLGSRDLVQQDPAPINRRRAGLIQVGFSRWNVDRHVSLPR